MNANTNPLHVPDCPICRRPQFTGHVCVRAVGHHTQRLDFRLEQLTERVEEVEDGPVGCGAGFGDVDGGERHTGERRSPLCGAADEAASEAASWRERGAVPAEPEAVRVSHV